MVNTYYWQAKGCWFDSSHRHKSSLRFESGWASSIKLKSKHVKPPAVVGGETREQLKVAFVVVFKWAL